MVNDADSVIYVKLTVKIVNYAVNRQSLVTVTPLFTNVIYDAIFELSYICTTLFISQVCNWMVCPKNGCVSLSPSKRFDSRKQFLI